MDANGSETGAAGRKESAKNADLAAEAVRGQRGERKARQRHAKPHVIVIMADQLRYDVLGTRYTPNLNSLAADSAAFDRAYCASPLCVPARGAFFTGTYPNSNGCLINPWDESDAQYGHVRSGLPNLISLMEEDWDSWHVGKQHLLTGERMHQSRNGRTRWVAGMREYKQHLREHGQRAPGGPAYKSLVPEMAGGRTTRAKSYSVPTTGAYEPGFDHFFDGYFAHEAVAAIRGRDASKPMLLNAMFLAPHPPFDVPEPWHSMWAEGELGLPDNVGFWDAGQSPLQLYNLTGFVGTRYSRAEWEAIWRVYLGLVSLLDHCVGMIVDELKAQDMYEDALIVFTSDHGEMLGSHRLWQKMCMYEESVRVPLYVKLPCKAQGDETGCGGESECAPMAHAVDGRGDRAGSQDGSACAMSKDAAGIRIGAPVSAIDVLPTLCGLLGLDTPPGVQGVSLAPLLAGDGGSPDVETGGISRLGQRIDKGIGVISGIPNPADPSRNGLDRSMSPGSRPLFIQYDGNGARGNFQRCIITGRHKLIVDLFKDEHYLELYDVEADPTERRNLAFAEENAGLVLEMLGRLQRHMASTGDLLALPDPASLLRRFLQEREGK